MKDKTISIQSSKNITIVDHDDNVEIILGHEISLEIPPASSIVPTKVGIDILVGTRKGGEE